MKNLDAFSAKHAGRKTASATNDLESNPGHTELTVSQTPRPANITSPNAANASMASSIHRIMESTLIASSQLYQVQKHWGRVRISERSDSGNSIQDLGFRFRK
jgi:hypothetical protein